MKRLLTGIILFQLLIINLSGQEWVVPSDKKGKLSTFQFSDETRKAGENLFSKNCLSCHGTPGKENYLKLVPAPGDPASEKFQKNTDGEIFYKVSTGKGQMPSFRSVLTTVEIWDIVSYIRISNKSYVQQVMALITSSAYPGAEIKLALSYSAKDSTVILKALALKENSSVPVTDAEVKLLVHRTFGMLPVDEMKTTNKEGIATFKIPGFLPGDTSGMVLVSARFTNEETFGSVSKDTLIKAGIVTIPESLLVHRAMWNNVRMAPVWVILTYVIGLVTAWGFIFLVLMKLRDIYIVGESLSLSPEKEDNK